MLRKHAVLNNQLHTSGLQAIDVKGDGNCLFRAVSYLLTGSEDAIHAKLRASVAAFVESLGVVLGGVLDVSAKTLAEHVGVMCTTGVCVGEDAVLIIPDVIQRDITVYIAFVEPLLYRPSSGLAIGPQLQIAFNKGLGSDPGHYRAIVPLSLCEQLPSAAPSKMLNLAHHLEKTDHTPYAL